MSRVARQPDYLTTVAIPADTVAELGFGVEASVSATGEVGLPASHAPYLFSVHLPAGDDAGRLNVGAFDTARREVSIETVQGAIDVACNAGASRGVVHSMGIVSFEGAEVGDWDRTVAGLQRIADHARTQDFDLVLENVVFYWPPVPVHIPAERADRSQCLYQLGRDPQEWRQLWAAIDRDNVRLCLDTSHATTCAVATSDLAVQAAAGTGVPRRGWGADYARPLVGQLSRWASRSERLAPARGARNAAAPVPRGGSSGSRR